ncbi:hypothetical protein QJS04_geneDACA012872 [Acorus gramineus]|uniref:Uncharacterized protein n=1 Tax=Acorus gramineus TaxID=55184 RepID=A0AAV9BHF9_ACOGR|nr:hypothetical protein QJS04_geneDACA012872 [Acorus gramineus]
MDANHETSSSSEQELKSFQKHVSNLFSDLSTSDDLLSKRTFAFDDVAVSEDRAEEGIQGSDVVGDPVVDHPIEREDRLSGRPGGEVAPEDGSERGEREEALVPHLLDGVPHRVEEEVLAEEVHHEIPRVGGVAVAEPAKELDGCGGVGVGELEDLLDVFEGDADVVVVEGGYNGR